MITSTDLRPLAAACVVPDPDERARAVAGALESLRNPSATDLMAAVREGLRDDDRNVRVAMLRVLAGVPSLHHREEALGVVLAALRDPKRRVREVAVRVAQAFVGELRVAEAVRAIVEDEQETTRIRGIAFFVLSMSRARHSADREVATAALAALSASNGYRSRVLRRLCQLPEPDEAVTQLLDDFVRLGSKDEAVQATRALCGYRLARLDELADAAQRQWVTAHCQRGGQEREYWVPRDLRAAAPTEPS